MTASAAANDMGWGDIILGAGTLDTGTSYNANEMKKTAIQAGEEGIVMVKNENSALPLRPADTVAVFGTAQFWDGKYSAGGYHFGGIGSGAVWGNPEKAPIDAIKAAAAQGKFRLYSTISDQYRQKSNYTPTAKDYANAKAAGVNKAVVFLTRLNGEQDKDSNPYGDMQPGAGQWSLERKEINLIKDLRENFEQVIVVINSGNMVDTDWIKNGIDGVQVVDAALFSWYGGTYGATALANILSGDATPSGKLAQTAADINNYPTTKDFDNKAYTAYTEDVFMGYRYFETFNVPVNYEFGFGLSYTTFAMSDIRMTSNATHITVKVTVKNTGNYAGKEVVQVYFSAPQKGTGSAKLAKPAKELAGYAKTDELKPGQSQEVTVKFPVSELASYDDTGVTGKKAAWVMEAGDYTIFVGNSVKNVKQAGVYKQSTLKVVEQLTTKLTPQALDIRMTWNGSGNVAYETVNTGMVKEPVLTADTSKGQQNYDQFITFDDLLGGRNTVEQLVSQMTIDELASFTVPPEQDSYPYGTPFGGSLAVSQKYGTPIVNTADGPAGINTYEWSFPCATALACTWNLDILADFGTVTGKYAKGRNSYDFWLAPGVNMQRNPRGGRNYEYFSEDALVTGLCGTAIVAKCQALGLSVAVKHYIANDKEQARSSCDSRVSERAMREVYLRPFEFLAKIGKATSFMMGYNVVNGVQIHSYQELLELPRTEWGWDGMYMSDWGDLNCGMTQAYIAGSNVAMNAISQSPTLTDYSPMVQAHRDGKVNRTLLEQNAATVVRVLLYHEKGVEYRAVGHYDATGPIIAAAPNVTTKPDPTASATLGNGQTTVQAGKTDEAAKTQRTTVVKPGQPNDTVHTSVDASVGDIPDDTSSTTAVLTNADGTPVLTSATKDNVTLTNADGTPIVSTTAGDGSRPTDTEGVADSLLWLYVIVGVVVISGGTTIVLLAVKNKKAIDGQTPFEE